MSDKRTAQLRAQILEAIGRLDENGLHKLRRYLLHLLLIEKEMELPTAGEEEGHGQDNAGDTGA